MAEKSNAEQFASALEMMAQTSRDMKSLNREFEEATDFAKDFSSILGQIVKTSDGLPRGIKTVKDLTNAMVKDEKLLEKMRQKAVGMHHDELTKHWKKKIAAMMKESGLNWEKMKVLPKFQKMQKMGLAIEENRTKELEEQFNLLKDQEKQEKKKKTNMEVLKEHAERAIKGVEQLTGLNISNGPLAFGISVLVQAFLAMKERAEEAVRATAKMTRTFGDMGTATNQTRKQAIGMGQTFEKLGLSLDAGQQAVMDFVHATKSLSVSKDLMKTGVALTQVFGLSSAEAGKLAIAYDRAGAKEGALSNTMQAATAAAIEMNVPVNDIIQSMGKSINVFQRFGVRGEQEFMRAAGGALQYGLTLDQVSEPLWEQLGTFEKSSDAAAKLNAVFGTHINSYQLMLAESPLDNMKLISGELIRQGKSWNNMNLQEKRVLKSTLSIDEETASLLLSEKNLSKGTSAVADAFKKQEAQQKKSKDTQKNWGESIGKLQETLINFKAEFKSVFHALGQNILAFVNGLFGTDLNINNVFKGIKQGLGWVTKKLEGSTGTSKTWGETFRGWIKTAAEFLETKLSPALDKIVGILDKLDMFTGGPFVRFLSGESKAGQWWAKKIDLGFGSGPEDDNTGVGAPGESRANYMARQSTAQDALITKTGRVIKFNPQDNILATKSPVAQTSQGATAVAGRGSSGGEQHITISPLPIYLDGKLIAQALFEQSRR